MKPNGRLILVGSIIVAAALYIGLRPEIHALAWHATHGRHVRLGQYQIPVPTWAYATADRDGASVTLFRTPGLIQRSLLKKQQRAQITFSLVQIGWTAREKEMLNFDFNRLEFGSTVFAGEEKNCFKFLKDGTLDIICNSFGDKKGLEVRFLGNEALAPEYDNIISGIIRN